MARLKNGILGGITGKIGNIEGYMLNGEYIVRSRRRKSTKPRTEKQLANQQKFGTVNHFINPFIDFVIVGFNHSAIGKRQRPHNLAVSYQYKYAITGQYPDFTIDYSKVRVTEGSINIQNINASVQLENNHLNFTWTPDLTFAYGNDRVMLLAYAPALKEAVYTLCGAKRNKGIDVLELPDDSWKGQVIETYLSFRAENRMVCANSLYLGQIV
jgi:hypothetical protein